MTKKLLEDSIAEKWRQWKYYLKSKGFDSSKTEEEMAAQVPDPRVDKDQYRGLVRYWCSEKGKVTNLEVMTLLILF